MAAKISSFQKDGKMYPTIELKGKTGGFGFTFGLSKARLIVEHVDEIRRFVEEGKTLSQ